MHIKWDATYMCFIYFLSKTHMKSLYKICIGIPSKISTEERSRMQEKEN